MLRRRRRKRNGIGDSGTGQSIYRYEPVPGVPPHRETSLRGVIRAHLENHLGPSDTVFFAPTSESVPIEVLAWAPTSARKMYTLSTVGMSELPMTVPPAERQRGCADRAELIVCLPANWPLPRKPAAASHWADDDAYFPVRWLRKLARMPHLYRTWVGPLHVIPNGDPARPLMAHTRLSGWLLAPPITLGDTFDRLTVPGVGRIDFYGLVALHTDEMDHAVDHGPESLIDGLDRDSVSEYLDLIRKSSLRQ